MMMLLLVVKASAQGNLQFNQVLTFTGSIGVTANAVTSPIQTVPAGKVWKIEHVGGVASNQTSASVRFGIQVNSGISLTYWSNGIVDQNICPIWLKASDNLQFYYNNPGGTAQSCTYIISVVEFNIIP